jgi:hypothetical protein
LTATPIRPPSPSGTTPSIVPSAVTCPFWPTRSSLAVSRSVTSASPPGRKAIAHGTARSRATTLGSPGGAADTDAVGEASPPALEQAVSTAINMIVHSFLMCSILAPGP